MMMVGIAELKAHLSKYVRLAKGGQEIGVRDRSEVVARLLPCARKSLPFHARAAVGRIQDVEIPPLGKKRIDVLAELRAERVDR